MIRRLLWLIALIATAGGISAPAAAAPQIAAIAPVQYGYMIYGSGFGADPRRVTIIQNSSVLSSAAILSVSDSRIVVRSPTTGQLTIAVRVGDQVSPPVVYQVGHAPVISAIAPTAGGYTIFGAGFGTDRGRVIVIQNNAVLPSTALVAVTDNRIDVRAAVAGTVAISVRVAAVLSQAVTYAPANAPAITAITPTTQGYVVSGRGFGADRSRVSIAENNAVLPATAIIGVADNRIEVRSSAAGTVTILIRVGAILTAPATYRPPVRPPAIIAITPAPQGYAVLGSGFGTDRNRVSVVENNAVLPPTAIAAIADNRIDVRSPTTGSRTVAVRVGPLVSAPMPYRGGSPPTVKLIVPTADGYTIVGSGFGTDRNRVAIVENGALLPRTAVATLTDSQIIVRSPVRAVRLVVVRIDGMTSQPIAVPAPLPAPPRR